MGMQAEKPITAAMTVACPGGRASRGAVAQVLGAVAVPAVVVTIDHLAFASGLKNFDSAISYGVLLPLLVGQVALLSYASVRMVAYPALQWLVYVWSLILLDLVVFNAMMTSSRTWWEIGFSDLAFSLFAGQLSAVLVWLVLGDARWPWRIAVALVMLAVYAVLVEAIVARARDYFGEHVWAAILLAQSAAVLVICLVLRWCVRVRMARPAQPGTQGEPLRFSLYHVLAWMTAVCLVLVILKRADGIVLRQLESQEIFPAAVIAVCAAVGCIVAVWAALGTGWWLWRLLLLAATVVAGGFAVTLAAPANPGPPWNSRLEAIVEEAGAGWILWNAMATSLLAALLLFFRFRGLRLVRRQRKAA